MLFKSLKLGNLYLQNRIVMAPMCTFSAKDGRPNAFHRTHYAARALGGVGMVIIEATSVAKNAYIMPSDLALYDEKQTDAHRKLVKSIKRVSKSLVCVQLAHAGAKSSHKSNVSPSGLAFSNSLPKPKELKRDEIHEIIKKFKKATENAKKAGYDMVEIHAAHGFLINEFLSPLTNQRNDEFGGSAERRARFLELIMDEVGEILPFGVRLSCDEWHEGGNGINEAIQIAKICEQKGALYIHASAGGVMQNPSNMPEIKPLYQAQYAKAIKENVSISVIAVGLINTAMQGDELLNNGYCDMVAYGRELLRNPNFAFMAAKELNNENFILKPYLGAFK